jgi:hypothetical protein
MGSSISKQENVEQEIDQLFLAIVNHVSHVSMAHTTFYDKQRYLQILEDLKAMKNMFTMNDVEDMKKINDMIPNLMYQLQELQRHIDARIYTDDHDTLRKIRNLLFDLSEKLKGEIIRTKQKNELIIQLQEENRQLKEQLSILQLREIRNLPPPSAPPK